MEVDKYDHKQNKETINKLGISGIYIGKKYLIDAVEMALNEEDAIHAVTKRIYFAIADKYGVPSPIVERNIRTVIEIFWERGNKTLLDQIVGYHIIDKPKNGEFIAMIADYSREEK